MDRKKELEEIIEKMSRADELEELIERMKGLSYMEWQKIQWNVNANFDAQKRKLERELQLGDMPGLKASFRSLLG